MYVDGVATTEKTFSLKFYFEALLSATYSELGITKAQYIAMRTLISDLAEYGAAAQTYTSYDTSHLVSADLDDYASDEVAAPEFASRSLTGSDVGATFTGASIRFDGENKLYLVLSVDEEKLANITVKVQIGEGAEMTFASSSFVKISDGVYALCSQAVKATEYASTITAKIYYNETLGQTLTYSVQAYVYAKQGGGDNVATLVKALWKYGLSAVAFKNA